MKNYWTFIKESKEHKEIHDICKKYRIESYTINEDGTIDVNGAGVILSNMGLTKFPLRFGTVTGGFYCSNNNLLSLEGAPSSVGVDFDCQNNNLTSLEGCPSKVGGNFNCKWCQLTSLEGSPEQVGGDFVCYENRLTSLIGGPSSVGGEYYCQKNELTSLEGGPVRVGGYDYYCHYNKLTSFKGFPEQYRDSMYVTLVDNPVVEVYNLFGDTKAITSINEWDVIDPTDMTVSYGALCEVYNDLDMEAPPREEISLKHYTLVD